MPRVYLDAASGQEMSGLALQALSGFADRAWADPLLTHHEGRTSASILQAARTTVAQVLGCAPAAVSFHRSEAVAALAVRGALASPDSGRVWASAIERDTVLRACRQDPTARLLAVDGQGKLLADELEPLGPTDIAVVQAANLEIGTRQDLPITQDSRWICDLTGSLGMVDVSLAGMTVCFADAYTWAGPPGVSILVVLDSLAWRAPQGVETGPDGYPLDTADVLSAATAAAALHAAMQDRDARAERMYTWTERIRNEAPQLVEDVEVLGSKDRLPHVVTLSVLYGDGERLAVEFDRRGIAIGSGSACAARSGLPSHVLAAIDALTHGNIRISLPLAAGPTDVDRFLTELPEVVEIVRAEAGAP